MFEKLKEKFVGFVLQKYVLGHIVALYSKTEGYKSQTLAVIAGAVYGAQWLGWIDPAAADAIFTGLLAAGGITLSDKVVRWKKVADGFYNDNRDKLNAR